MSKSNKYNSIKIFAAQLEKNLKQTKKNIITNHKPKTLSKKNISIPISNRTKKMKFYIIFFQIKIM